MTPRRLDSDVIRAKLDAIERSRQTLLDLHTVDATQLAQDPVIAAAVERLLTRLVDLTVDINSHVAAAQLGRAPGEYRESFDLAVAAGLIDATLAEELKPAVGLRNIIIHEYARLDLQRVADAVPRAVDAAGHYVTAVAQYLTT